MEDSINSRSDDSYIIRVGWRKVGYELNRDEFDTYNRVVNFMTVLSIFIVFSVVFWGLITPSLLDVSQREWLAILGGGAVAVLYIMYTIVAAVVRRSLTHRKQPVDQGFGFFEHRRNEALRRWEKSKLLSLLYLGAVVFVLYERDFDALSLWLGAVWGTALLECVYYQYLSPHRPV